MNKVELISKVVEVLKDQDVKMTKKDMGTYVDTVFGVIADTVASGEDVSISNFGKFTVVERAAREGHNPATGEAIHIEASKAPKFKASSVFKAAVKNA